MLKFLVKLFLWMAAILFSVGVAAYRPLPENVMRAETERLSDTEGTSLAQIRRLRRLDRGSSPSSHRLSRF